MNKISIIGIDLAKHVFQLHAADERGNKVFSKTVQRDQLRLTLAQLPPCRVAMEACGSAHYWAREIQALGHETELLPPQSVKPFVLGHKNDARDAAAIAEAAARPAPPRVAIRRQAQQPLQPWHRVRSRLIRDRTSTGNELRGLMSEFGLIVSQGHAVMRQGVVRELLDTQHEHLGDELHLLLTDLLGQWLELDTRVKHYDKRIQALAKASEQARQLMSLPGIGPINATLLISHIGDPARFPNGRQFSASLGLVPRQYSSGGACPIEGDYQAWQRGCPPPTGVRSTSRITPVPAPGTSGSVSPLGLRPGVPCWPAQGDCCIGQQAGQDLLVTAGKRTALPATRTRCLKASGTSKPLT